MSNAWRPFLPQMYLPQVNRPRKSRVLTNSWHHISNSGARCAQDWQSVRKYDKSNGLWTWVFCSWRLFFQHIHGFTVHGFSRFILLGSTGKPRNFSHPMEFYGILFFAYVWTHLAMGMRDHTWCHDGRFLHWQAEGLLLEGREAHGRT